MRTERTAISRSRLSAPAACLLEKGLLEGRILDFGCGKGDLARFLDGDISEYDPYYVPKRPKGKFDVVVCNYVLNVLPPGKRMKALSDAQGFVRPHGHLYITVRRDLLQNTPTTFGTRQFHVVLDYPELVHRHGRFMIYDAQKSHRHPR